MQPALLSAVTFLSCIGPGLPDALLSSPRPSGKAVTANRGPIKGEPMNITTLCAMLKLEQYFAEEILTYDKLADYEKAAGMLDLLYSRATWKNAVTELQEWVGEDERGIKILTLYLHCLLKTHEMYLEKGISDAIFRDTMGFIPRFVKSHRETHGYDAFVWPHWFPRQIAMCEFRVGEYEYEFLAQDDEKKIYLHIPSDADLKSGDIEEIYPFAEKYFPEYADAKIYCNSWLLAPALTKLLPEDSNIIRFQSQFSILEAEPDNPSFMSWIFGSKELACEQLPERTLLQRHAKQYLLSGGKIGRAHGRYIPRK